MELRQSFTTRRLRQLARLMRLRDACGWQARLYGPKHVE